MHKKWTRAQLSVAISARVPLDSILRASSYNLPLFRIRLSCYRFFDVIICATYGSTRDDAGERLLGLGFWGWDVGGIVIAIKLDLTRLVTHARCLYIPDHVFNSREWTFRMQVRIFLLLTK